MANQKLTELLGELAEANRAANMNLEGWDPRTLPGMEMRKRHAEDEVKTLTSAYRNIAANHILKIFVKGPKASEFADHAAKSGLIVVDGSDLYRTLAKGVDGTVDHKSRVFNAQQQLRLVTELGEYGVEAGLKSLPMPKFDMTDLNKEVPTFEDTVVLVKKGVRETAKDDLNKHHLQKKVIDAALKYQATQNVIPVVLTNLTEDEIAGLSKSLFNPTHLILVADENSANEQLVESVNEKILSMAEAVKK